MMPLLPAGVFHALVATLRRKKRPVRRGGARPRRNCVGLSMGGERLEVRTVPSASPIVATSVPISGYETHALNNVPVAMFTDGNGSQPAANFNAVIVWGDGAMTSGGVIEINGSYVVVGSHTYSDINDNPVVVGIFDTTNPAATALLVDSANIAPILPDGTQGSPDEMYVYEVLKDTQPDQVTMGDVNYWTAQFEKNHADPATFTSILLETTPPYTYNQGQIEKAYETYLHRPADPNGLNYYLNLVLNSNGLKSLAGTETQTSAMLIASNEFYQDAGGTTDGFITAVYEDALKRAPDPGALAYWGYNLTHGMTRIDFASDILRSDEYLTLTIDGLYEKYLGRAPDPQGMQNFLFNYHSGYGTRTNTETLLGTPEFYNRAAGLPLNTVD